MIDIAVHGVENVVMSLPHIYTQHRHFTRFVYYKALSWKQLHIHSNINKGVKKYLFAYSLIQLHVYPQKKKALGGEKIM